MEAKLTGVDSEKMRETSPHAIKWEAPSEFGKELRDRAYIGTPLVEFPFILMEYVIALEKRVKELEKKPAEPEKIRVLPFVMYSDVMNNHKEEYEVQLGMRCTLPGKDGPVLLPPYELASLKAAIVSEIGQRIGYGRDADGWYKTKANDV